jgi:hypothetical protein
VLKVDGFCDFQVKPCLFEKRKSGAARGELSLFRFSRVVTDEDMVKRFGEEIEASS